jgi:hypothetical protein
VKLIDNSINTITNSSSSVLVEYVRDDTKLACVAAAVDYIAAAFSSAAQLMRNGQQRDLRARAMRSVVYAVCYGTLRLCCLLYAVSCTSSAA